MNKGISHKALRAIARPEIIFIKNNNQKRNQEIRNRITIQLYSIVKSDQIQLTTQPLKGISVKKDHNTNNMGPLSSFIINIRNLFNLFYNKNNYY